MQSQNTLMLSKDVAQKLKDMIINKEFLPGEQLPNEMVLAEKMGVSRSTIREAIKQLVPANIVEIKRGRGTFVCKHPGWKDDPLGVEFMSSKDLLMNLFETRIMIEPGVAALAAKRAKAEDIEKLKASLERMRAMYMSRENHSQEDLEFHMAIARATQNPILQRVIPIINESIVGGYEETVNIPESIHKAVEAHERIYKAIAAEKPNIAEREMRRHLQMTVEDIRQRGVNA